jgi:hypothetical protein
MMVYFTKPENEIRFSVLGNKFWHIFDVGITDVYVSNSTGSNILPSNIKQDTFLNAYNIQNHFGKYTESLNYLCNNSNGLTGQFTYLSFCQDGSDNYNEHFTGGMPFAGSSDHIINFTSLSTVNNVVMNLVFFTPAVLTLENGELIENLC